MKNLPALGTKIVSLIVVAVIAIGAIYYYEYKPRDVQHLSADFSRTVGLYTGSDVRVLGVKVGRVEKITPRGDGVHVEMTVDRDRPIPANAEAVIIEPSVVGGRYVQLTPVYGGAGPTLADGATIPRDHTAVPVEIDQIYSSLNDLSKALGPNGANSTGALSRLVDTGAANLKGNGADIGKSLHDLSIAVQTLSGGRKDLVGTITNLQTLTGALAANDGQVRQFNQNLASVSAQLAGERTDLGAALRNLSTALGQVATFVRDNKGELKKNVSGLADITQILVDQRAALAQFLDVAPTTLSNLNNAYNGVSGTLDTRNNFAQLGDPTFVCSLLESLPGHQQLGQVEQTCDSLSKQLGNSLPKIPGVNTPPPGLPLGDLPKVPELVPGLDQLTTPIPGVLNQITKIPGVPELPTVPGVILGGGE
ncbi:MAG TPA: MCE family protein [Mycobacteriales bacterium]|nr:MCE family protein [Mycobacteriales bacterium]